MLSTRILSMVVVTLGLIAPAAADDEGSEQTAKLVGAAEDTVGISVEFTDTDGWVMSVRPRPGANERTFGLAALGKRHGHYHVFVSPGRSRITFVESSIGLEGDRPSVGSSDVFALTWSADGVLLRAVSYGQAFTPAELGKFGRTVSHMTWLRDAKVTPAGLELTVDSSSRKILIDARTGAVR